MLSWLLKPLVLEARALLVICPLPLGLSPINKPSDSWSSGWPSAFSHRGSPCPPTPGSFSTLWLWRGPTAELCGKSQVLASSVLPELDRPSKFNTPAAVVWMRCGWGDWFSLLTLILETWSFLAWVTTVNNKKHEDLGALVAASFCAPTRQKRYK